MGAAGAVGEGIAADKRFGESGDGELEGQVLPWFERRKWLSIMGFQIEREGVGALHDLLFDSELADAIPGEFGMLHRLDAGACGLDFKGQPFSFEAFMACSSER